MSRVRPATLVFLSSLITTSAQAADACHAQSGPQTGALLELYTSEGCSSCPPADKWLADMAAGADPARLSLLGFHVDYWDDGHWQDRFASHDFTERQTARVHTGGSTTIYTPQVIVGSRVDQRWNQPDAVAATIRSEQSRPSTVGLVISTSRLSEHIVADLKATPVGPIARSAQLYLALYQNQLSSKVKAGENKGVTLHHEHVVRGLWGPWPVTAAGAAKSLRITPPNSASLEQLGLTAFVQDARTGETLQALSLPLTACAAP